ncbi:MAG: MBOAT family protein [Deltaproteobacteria bacterium]|nr:MBOAT family protein [Deltaproteobacteria bacterium]
MLFNSHIYLFIFLPLSVILYFQLNHSRFEFPAKAFLIVANLFFYAWGDIEHLPILIISVVFNFGVGRLIDPLQARPDNSHRKFLLILGVSVNIGLLCFFKYTDFFIDNLNLITGLQIKSPGFSFPLAISFFTFVQIAYLVDRYRGEAEKDNFVNYTLFATFFPQLLSGPIVRHKEMKAQYAGQKERVINWENIYAGLIIFSMGLFKKVFVADTLAAWVSAGFAQAGSLNMVEAWAASLSFTLQIYYDFSGYTDMAIGSALFLNIRLPRNFNSPYKALNIQDFWRRWHMTLSGWLRDYLFIPLGGSRCGRFNTYRNIMITFILCGLWHGAGWTFIFWGLLHGMALATYRVWSRVGIKMPGFLAWLLTFLFLNVSWIFFRAPNFQTALEVVSGMTDVSTLHSFTGLKNMFTMSSSILDGNITVIFTWIFISLGMAAIFRNSNQWVEDVKPAFRWAFVAVILLLLGLPDFQQPSEFIYFNF